jgi:hypothetical protein
MASARRRMRAHRPHSLPDAWASRRTPMIVRCRSEPERRTLERIRLEADCRARSRSRRLRVHIQSDGPVGLRERYRAGLLTARTGRSTTPRSNPSTPGCARSVGVSERALVPGRRATQDRGVAAVVQPRFILPHLAMSLIDRGRAVPRLVSRRRLLHLHHEVFEVQRLQYVEFRKWRNCHPLHERNVSIRFQS